MFIIKTQDKIELQLYISYVFTYNASLHRTITLLNTGMETPYVSIQSYLLTEGDKHENKCLC